MSRKGFATIFLVIILLSFTLSILVVCEIASGFAGATICKALCAISGRSVLSEYDNELFDKYGLFMLRKSESFIKEKSKFYIENSLNNEKSFIQIKVLNVNVNYDNYIYDKKEFERQCVKLYGNLTEYILHSFSYYTNQIDDSMDKLEIEKIICAKASDEDNLEAIKKRLFAVRFSVDLINNENYNPKEHMDRLINCLLPGFVDDIIDFSEDYAVVKKQAQKEVDLLLAGGNLEVLGNLEFDLKSYEDYLRLFLNLSFKDIKIVRAMSIITNNINQIKDFSFDDYIFGFDLELEFVKKSSAVLIGVSKRNGKVFQEFVYK